MMISNVSNFGSPNYGYSTPFRGATTDGMDPEQTGFTPAPAPTDNFNSSTSTQAPKKGSINWLAWGALGSGILAGAYGLYKIFK